MHRFYQVKVKSLGVTSLKELRQLMGKLRRQAFRKAYGKIWDLAMAEVSIEAIASLAQYYDQPLRCFTFGDFQLSPTVEEFEEILGCPLGGRKPYLFSRFYPSLARISKIVQISTQELDHRKQVENGVVGVPRKCLEAKARVLAGKDDWTPFMDILALLIFGGVLFPNVDGLVDQAAIVTFLAFHDRKESPVVAILADLYDTFDRRCEKNSTRIVFCTLTLYVRHACTLEGHRSCTEKKEASWDQLLARKEGVSVNWFPQWKEGRTGFLISCGGFPNVPLMGTRGCINYNPILAIRQLGYPMRGAPLEEDLTPIIARGFNSTNAKALQKVCQAWEMVQKKDKELRGSSNGPICGYHRWLKAYTQGLDWLPNLRTTKGVEVEAPEEDEEFKSAAIRIQKENAKLRDVNIAITKALEQETKRARREEHGRNKFRGTLWGSNSELKLQREEKDQSRVDSLILKDDLRICLRSKRSLSQWLCETETNMLAIISKYQEELNLATAHEHKVADEYARKEQMSSMMDAMLGMRQLMENNAATVTAVSLAAEADATLPATTHHPIPNVVGRERSTLGHISNPHPGAPVPIQRMALQAPTLTPTRSAGNAHFGVGSNAIRNFPPRPTQEFAPIPMTYEDLLPSLVANQMAVISPEKIYQPHFPKWYNPNTTCAYYGRTPGHSTEQCMAFKRKVQSLIEAGWLTFQEDRPNVKTNPLANTEGELLMPSSRGGVIPRGGHEKDSCLMHPGAPHSMETCLAVGDLLQQMIDQGRLEVSDEGDEEQHICMQSRDEEGLKKPKPLMIHFTRDAAPQTPRHPSVVRPIPFLYKNSHTVPWRYAPPSERKDGAIDISLLSAKVTNITGLSGMTRSGRVFAPPDLPTQPANAKGKAMMTEGQNVKVIPAPDEDVPMKGLSEGRDGCDKKEVSLEEAGEFLCIIQQSEFKVIEQHNKTPTRVSLLKLLMSSEPHRALLVKVLNEAHPGMGLGKNNGDRTSLVSTRGNHGKFGLGYKPMQADIRKSILERKNKGQSPRLGQQAEGAPPCHISRSFISAGLRHEGQVATICEDDSPRRSDLVRPCPPDPTTSPSKVLIPGTRPSISSKKRVGWRVKRTRMDMIILSNSQIPSQIQDRDESRVSSPGRAPPARNGDGLRPRLCSEKMGQATLPPSPCCLYPKVRPPSARLGLCMCDCHFWMCGQLAEVREMAPKKLSTKRSRRDATGEGSSAASEFDSHHFRSAEHQRRFEAIRGWSFHRERRVQLREDEYTDFQEEIAHRRWTPLVTPMAKFDPEIVLEFYASAWPTKEGVRDMYSWVRGQWIPFDADALSQFLGDPVVLEEGQQWQDFARTATGRWVRIMCTSMTTLTQTWMTLLLSNVLPSDHNSDLPLPKCQLVYVILTRMSMAPTRHPLDPDKSNRALGFSALITGLCQSYGVLVTPSKAQGDAHQAVGTPPPPRQADPAGPLGVECYLQHLVRQQAANHRGQVQIHECLYQFSLNQQGRFGAEVAWPGDWPDAQAGEEPIGSPGEADESHMDEDMTDLLDFLGGSGAT
ncbi:hypothetical protein HKD37_02G004641 [Glycine soja]